MDGTMEQSEAAVRRRVLVACVELFLANGFRHTQPKQIFQQADISDEEFFELFGTKGDVLNELVKMMFDNQFAVAGEIVGADADPLALYAVEVCLQLTLVGLSRTLREIYVDAYSRPDTRELLSARTAVELYRIFSPYEPGSTVEDFRRFDPGIASTMRTYMARPDDAFVPLESKKRWFLNNTFRYYHVPEEKSKSIADYAVGLDLRASALEALERLFRQLDMDIVFTPDDPAAETL